MEFLERMNAALDYIEAHLQDDCSWADLARVAGTSEYQLSRTFPFMTGQGLGQYLRRRRMTQAAMDLRTKEDSLLDLAVVYGYTSVDSFTRAFREVHGTSPSAVRSGTSPARAYHRLTFSLSIQGAQAMVYRLTTITPFRLVGITRRVPLVFSGPNPAIDAMWQSLEPGLIAQLKSLAQVEPKGIISASHNFSEDRMEGTGTLDHWIGVATIEKALEGLATLEIGGGEWAVFQARGNFPHTLQTTWGRIYSEWLPQSNYQLRPGPEILWNEGPDTTKPDFTSEIWIPVQRSS